MTRVVGLTGSIASGKSTVSQMFKDLGFEVIDADLEAKQAVETGEAAYIKILEVFGKEILLPNGSIDRAKLGNIIFNNANKRQLLNNIVHPEVRKRMIKKRDVAVSREDQLVVMDIPLLFESQLTYMVDEILLVFVDEEVQLRRLRNRNSFSEEEAIARIKSQMPMRDKLKLADQVIDNNGSIENTKSQVHNILKNWNVTIN